MSVVLSEHLPLLASAPEGIQKLRGLILELAVRGKLVPQDPDDEPASELLNRVVLERARLEKDGVCKKSKASLSEEKEQPFELPHNWAWTNLASVALINPRNAANDSIEVSFVPMAMIGSRFEGSHQQELRKWGEVKQGFTHFAEGDIGVAKITPCFENSKACVFAGLKNGIGAGTTELHIVRPIGQALAPRYVLAYLKAPIFLLTGETKMTGTAGQKRLPKDFLEANPFPLPPLAEQHRIVAKVDELMALCDQLEAEQADAASTHVRLVETLLGTLTQSTDATDLAANWQRLTEHFDALFTTEASIDALKQTVLQLAVMGKLVPQDPNDEPASKLLKQIALEQVHLQLAAGGIRRKMKSLSAVDESNVPFALPSGWAWARFPEVGQFGRGKSKHRPRNDPALFNPGIYPLVQTGEVARAGTVVREIHSKYSDAGLSQSKMWPQGTLCITIAANIADSAILGFDACFPDSVVGFIPSELIGDSYYFLWFMKTAREELLKFAPSTAQKNINLEILESVRIPLPPKAEMQRIVAKIGELMALCDRLIADLATARQRQATLADTLIESALEAA